MKSSKLKVKSKPKTNRRAPAGADGTLSALKRLLTQADADGASLALSTSRQRTIRFAFGRVHQDLFQQSSTCCTKIAVNGRVGVAVAHSGDTALWRAALAQARAIAAVAPKVAGGVHWAAPQPVPRMAIHVPATARVAPADYLARLQQLMQLAEGCHAQLAGSLVIADDGFGVMNSAGVAAYQPSTVVGLKLIAMGPHTSGYASHVVRDIRALDWEGCLERALKKCLTTRPMQTLPPGKYRVLLEPDAIAEILGWLGYLGFGAKQFAERTSFLCGRMGDKLTGESITITDDATDPAGLAFPFDFEGVPTQPVTLIDRGIGAGLVYDTHYARLYDTHSTGHAPSPDATEGPLPGHLQVAAGNATYDAMVRALDRGIIVTRFHYVNGFLDPRNTLMTGLTRDGTFLVEDGKIVAPLRNLRFTERMLEAFGRARLISRDRTLIADPAQDGGGSLCPAMLINDFTFTGHSADA